MVLFPLRVFNRIWASKNSVSVIKLAAMGDLICLYPSLFALKEKGFEVNLITTKRSNPKIFENHSAISKIIILDTNFKMLLSSFWTFFGQFQTPNSALMLISITIQVRFFLFKLEIGWF